MNARDMRPDFWRSPECEYHRAEIFVATSSNRWWRPLYRECWVCELPSPWRGLFARCVFGHTQHFWNDRAYLQTVDDR